MATIEPVFAEITGRGEHIEVSWSGMSGGDQGRGVRIHDFSDKTVQFVSGTAGTSALNMEGSLDTTDGVDGTWTQLHDPQGTAIALETTALEAILENPTYVRPNVGAGSGSAIKIAVIATAQMHKR